MNKNLAKKLVVGILISAIVVVGVIVGYVLFNKNIAVEQISNSSKEDKSITVLSPNGGETLKAGEKVLVKWTTKGFATSSGVWIYLQAVDNNRGNIDLVKSYNDVLNTGEAIIILPENITVGRYKMFVTVKQELEDFSDTYFTIVPAEIK